MSKKKIKTTKAILPSYKAQSFYNKALNSFIKEIEEKCLEQLERVDDTLTDTIEELLLLVLSYIYKDKTFETIAKKHVNLISAIHLKKFDEGLRNIGFKAIHNSKKLNELLGECRAVNIGLIKSIPMQLHDRLNKVLHEAYESELDLVVALKKEFSISRNRAKLIARDQTAKINAALNKLRAKENGSTHYKWRTSGDERVRETSGHNHKKLEKKVFSWEEGSPCCGHPGDEVNCRCLALAVY